MGNEEASGSPWISSEPLNLASALPSQNLHLGHRLTPDQMAQMLDQALG